MTYFKFLGRMGIAYTILPRLTLAVYPVPRSDEGVVGRRGQSQAA